jgi:hypothetical protein
MVLVRKYILFRAWVQCDHDAPLSAFGTLNSEMLNFDWRVSQFGSSSYGGNGVQGGDGRHQNDGSLRLGRIRCLRIQLNIIVAPQAP